MIGQRSLLIGAILSLMVGALMLGLAPHAASAADDKPDAMATKGMGEYGTSREESGPGYEVFKNNCAQCHDQHLPGAPSRSILQLLAPKAIYGALTTGRMREQASALSDQQKRDVAEWLSNLKLSTAPAQLKMCKGKYLAFDEKQQPSAPGWGLSPGNTHFIADSATSVRRDNVDRLELKWAFAYPDGVLARSQPTLAGGAVYVGGDDGTVYALERTTGCVRWTFKAGAEVRHAVVITPWTDEKSGGVAYFGDFVGNVYALDIRSGKQIWMVHPEAHPAGSVTGSPVLHEDVLYVPISSQETISAGMPNYACCTFRGLVVALDAATGTERWRTYTIPEAPKKRGKNSAGADRYGPSGAAVWGTPVVDPKRSQLYFGTSENYSSPATKTSDAMFAVDLKSGAVKWVYQGLPHDAWNTACMGTPGPNCPKENGPDFDFGAGLMLVSGSDGKDYVVGSSKSGVTHAVDPDTGKVIWTNKVGAGGITGGTHWGIAAGPDVLYIPINDLDDGRKLNEPRRPGLYALKPSTGEFLWKAPMKDECGGRPNCKVGNSAAISATSDLVAAVGGDGILRLYDAKTGAVLRQIDTTPEIKTVSGAMGHGGSQSGASAPIFDGRQLFVNSGYGFASFMPGNLLLVYELKK